MNSTMFIGIICCAIVIHLTNRRIDKLVDRQRKTDDEIRRLNELIGLMKDEQ